MSTSNGGAPALELRGLVKQYGGVHALRGASLSAAHGTVHGLIGQNGAGKSTLIKILAGLERADAGEIRVDGVQIDAGARSRIAFIHQERLLSPTFSVAEALALDDEPTVAPRARALRALLPLDVRRMRRRAIEALGEHFGIALPPDRLIGELSVAEQQIVQITRALIRSPRILVFDEPTAALVSREVDRLLRTIDQLRARGLTILYVSHYLNEITSLCDGVTVLRDGADVAHVDAREAPIETLVSAMIGAQPAARARRASASLLQDVVLEARDLHAPGRFGPLSFTLRRGEVLGVTGLVGSGGKPLVRSLFGLERGVLGELRVRGKTVRLRRPADAVRKGIAFVPEDRRRQGVATALPVRDNLSLPALAGFSRFGLIDTRRETAAARALIDTLGVRTAGPLAPVRHLSGGNQQKVALGKWLGRATVDGAAIYLLDEPTVGVDVGAKADIYRLIDTLVAQGAAVLIFSSDLHELLDVTDRVLVLARGAIVQDVPSHAVTTLDLLAWATLARTGDSDVAKQEGAA
ncbi:MULTISPECIES: sugar ABC transporter ATP-binding protein [unclassified Paraburkholderia]|uniref:sugar ABC transporter ATP-binding protein n=1 Tax=unclassified Paraburkholderia TaxID=2615204 RepID=UPI002AB21F5C|nr:MULTISPECIES: sugar ABC transporter ATP-binding protein [unclassified Paraburkholderia]